MNDVLGSDTMANPLHTDFDYIQLTIVLFFHVLIVLFNQMLEIKYVSNL